MDSYFEAGLASSTVRTYAAGIRHYSSFCQQVHTQATPTNESILCRFVTHLANNNISHNAIRVYLAGVRQLHIRRSVRMPELCSMPRLNQVLRGIKIRQSKSGTVRQQPRLPITPEVLLRIKSTWEREGINTDRIMLWAAFTTCFFGFMRSGEICKEMDESISRTGGLTPQDVEIDNLQNPQTLRIRLRHSKTDPFCEGSDIFFSKTNDELCPVSALLAWLVQRKTNHTGPLFLFQSGAPLTRSTFVSCLKEALTNAGIDSTRFAGHSFRIGAATTAARRGLSDSAIKQLGRWKSTAYQRYIQPSPTTLGSLASSISTDNQKNNN